MPGRTRRVRLIAIVLCIATVFFVYERNAARVDEVASYWSRQSVGGGSVLRNDEKPEGQQHQQQPPEQEPIRYTPEEEPRYSPAPAPILESESVPAPTTSSSLSSVATTAMWDEEGTTTLATSASAVEEEQLPTKTPDFGLPSFYGDYGSVEVGLGSSEPTTSSVMHWTKVPEKFPVTSTIQLPTTPPSPIPRIQKQGEGKGKADHERLSKIKEACKHAWKGFRSQGWGYDEVRPVTGGGLNTFNGWGATLVDSLDTLFIMGMMDEFEEAVNKTAEIDFTTSPRHDVPLFEVTIRYLGGMLGGYDVSGRKHHILLEKAVELAELLYSAFDTPNRMPETYYEWRSVFASNTHRASVRAVMAELGTLSLEFTRLAQLTGEPKYYDAIARITDEFEKWQNNTRLPGMWPTDMDASGCKKPIRKSPTRTKPYVHYTQKALAPGSDDSYIITSDPVQIDQDLLTKVEHMVDEVTQKTGPNRKMGTVVNPYMHNAGHGHGAVQNSNMRHSMDDDPWMKQNSPIREDSTNHASANEPLPPGAGSSESGVKIENPSVGFRPSDPLLPNAGSSGGVPHQKRQLDELDITLDQTLPSQDLDDVTYHESVTKQDDLDASQISDTPDPILEEEEEEPEDLCQPQGFASCSSYSTETFTLGGKSDSTFEYLPKEYLLLGGRLEQYKTMYLESMKPVVDKLIFRPMNKDNLDILVSGEVSVGVNFTTDDFTYEHYGRLEHLTCFAGGMFAMGGMLFDNPEHVEIGRKLTEGCVWAYNSTGSGIMPDGARLLICEDPKDCAWNETAWYESLDYLTAEYRQAQLDEWKETYEVDDVAAFRKHREAEEAEAIKAELEALEAAAIRTEAEAEAEAEAIASLATETEGTASPASETATPTPDSFVGEAERPLTVPEARPGLHHNTKRQIDDTTNPNPTTPQYAQEPTPEALLSASVSVGEYGVESDSWADNTPFDRQVSEDVYSISTPVVPPKPTYTPDPPSTHEEYVRSRIEEDRIPPGFTSISGNGYILRPEAIESVFYMYRITGEQHWRDVGWKMFLAVESQTRTKYGHSSLEDVTKSKPEHSDKMESFWIAETLKYFYLLFDDPDTWSLDDWVLNTEAHFFRRPRPAASGAS